MSPEPAAARRPDLTIDDRTDRSGAAERGWGTSAAFLDADLDGDLDLYAANYVAFDPARNPWSGLRRKGYRSYCHPGAFEGAPDRFFRNTGEGTIEDRSEAAGVTRAGRFGFDDARSEARTFFEIPRVARGLAMGELDADGDEDAIVTTGGGSAVVLRNDAPRRGEPLRVVAHLGSPPGTPSGPASCCQAAGDRSASPCALPPTP